MCFVLQRKLLHAVNEALQNMYRLDSAFQQQSDIMSKELVLIFHYTCPLVMITALLLQCAWQFGKTVNTADKQIGKMLFFHFFVILLICEQLMVNCSKNY